MTEDHSTMQRKHPTTTREAVLVTGVAHGIGRAIVERLLTDGHVVVGLDKDALPPPGLTDFRQIDMTDTPALKTLLDDLTTQYSFTRLVNNVGSSRREFLSEATAETQRWLNRLNLATAVTCLQAVAPTMRAAGFGRIVNITSRASMGRDNRSAYAATKAALSAMTRAWAVELAKDGITVNSVGPGMIDTELFRRNNPADAPDVIRLKKSVPMERLGLPHEVAEAVSFFLAERASYITGQAIYVCGGLSITGGRPSREPNFPQQDGGLAL